MHTEIPNVRVPPVPIMAVDHSVRMVSNVRNVKSARKLNLELHGAVVNADDTTSVRALSPVTIKTFLGLHLTTTKNTQ